MVWQDVSNCAKQFADPEGKAILEKQWNGASTKFNECMPAGDIKCSFAMLHQANGAFAAVAPHINNPKLKAYFLKINKDFGDELETEDVGKINAFMVRVHPDFQAAAQGL